MSNQHSPVDPVDAIGGVSKSSNSKPVPMNFDKNAVKTPKKGESEFLYSSNYILEVMKLTNLAMQNQADIVSMQAKLQKVILDMQNDFSTINQFFSKLQAQAHAGGGVHFYHGDLNDLLSPNSVNGFDPSFYTMSEYTYIAAPGNWIGSADHDPTNGWGGEQAEFGGDYGVDPITGKPYISADYQQSMQSFLTAFKQLFYSSPGGDSTDVSVKDLSKIELKDGKTVDLFTSKSFDGDTFWGQIQKSFDPFSAATLNSSSGLNVISTTGTDQPSLIQQYIYYSAKIAASNGTLKDINPKNYEYNSPTCDTTLQNMLTVLNDMNTSAAVSGNTWTKSTTGNMLEMILDNKLYNTYQGSTTWGDYNAIYGYDRDGDLEGNGASGDPRKNNIDPGLFCAFSYMAYNYFWTKNPNALVDTENGHTNCNTSWTNGVNGGTHTAWDWEDQHQTTLADQLSYGYMHTNSTQTTLSSSSSTQNTTFQEATSNVQTMNNAAQQMIQSFSQGQGQTITNFKG